MVSSLRRELADALGALEETRGELEVAVPFGWIVLARGGLLPEITGGEEPVGAVAAEAFVEVQQRSDGTVLGCLEAGQGKAVAPAGVDQLRQSGSSGLG